MAVAVAAVAALIAGAIIAERRGTDHTGTTPAGPGPALTITDAHSFDPHTVDENKRENEPIVPRAFDGDPKTSWNTATYKQAHFTGLKDGVGIVLDLGQSATINRVELTTNTDGWSAEVYVADEDFKPDKATWGEPVATIPNGGRSEQVTLGPARGSKVLLWLTDTGQSGGKLRFELAEIVLR